MLKLFSNKLFIAVLIIITVVIVDRIFLSKPRPEKYAAGSSAMWTAPDSNAIPRNAEGAMIRYGKALISNTAFYLGPRGIVSLEANGMNCQNCHLDAGTKVWGNNFAAVYSTYPKFRARRGGMESMVQRINDCMERSLNGSPLDSNSREMQAMLAYMRWLGKDVPKGQRPNGSGIVQLPFLNRAADVQKGKTVFAAKCQKCHQANGQGMLLAPGVTYAYPPLWGDHSYNTGAGLYRLSSFAGYIKNNMPFGATYQSPQLTDEEAWDVAAFVNSQPRPHKNYDQDWPDIATKPFDHPFGPYADSFSEQQHKYGPYTMIKKSMENELKKKPS